MASPDAAGLASGGPVLPDGSMSLQKFHAIVLQSYETGDTSEVLHVFTGAHGRLSVMGKGLRSPKNRLRGILQPLSTLELNVYLREGADMATLRDAAPVTDRAALHADLERFALGAVLAEVASLSCDIAQESEEAFALLEHALDAISPAAPQPAVTAAVHYLIRVLALAGYEPNIEPALLKPWPKAQPRPVTFWLDLSEARVHADNPQPPAAPDWPVFVNEHSRHIPLPPESVRALYANQHTPTESLGELPALAHPHAVQFAEALIRLAGWHLEKPVRSARFWRSLEK